ncbi:2-amino-4-hydroxy-6-hydroxymethyldihydropteridine diphosphokinase [Schlesneria paludicola]|uniref:2-amino-4-hydroxy-6- hydroxymethyldihydropteridine diphosphokinase n=1 Tax=Schlesneria paludicola TaxID=360056 RepID=UPI00029A7EC1|nr:2-amino-4-hydroxy-6-hydroxymethyldihydropteridine diphosphokinase [Schlesneria paludicola]
MFSRTCLAFANETPSDQANLDRVCCWISFGGNVGDVKATFDAALALLSLHCHIQLGQRSGLYTTAPMGSSAGRPFINSVCELTTKLSPLRLLNVLQCVENQLGRVRDIRWGPRTLDLDILTYGQYVHDEPDLIVPHPALTYRRFVLDPLAEVATDWRHPVSEMSARQLVARLEPRPLRVALPEISPSQLDKLSGQLRTRFPEVKLVHADVEQSDVLRVRTSSPATEGERAVIDLRRSPGDLLEQLTSTLTAALDAPQRLSDW